MAVDSALSLSRLLLFSLGTQVLVQHQDRVPGETPILVVSNHRSFLDAPVLMAALNRSVRIACHHYMGQVPVMRELVTQLGCFPLDTVGKRQQSFLRQGTKLLESGQVVGVFPEGAAPMVHLTKPHAVGRFHRGFAHLALRTEVRELAVLPVAIASQEEQQVDALVPLQLLKLFDPTEPLFNQGGWHPVVLYRRLTVLIGRPYWVTSAVRSQYQGQQAKIAIDRLTRYCHQEISDLLQDTCLRS